METPAVAALPPELTPVDLVVGPDAVARYADLTGDYNPIHLDADFAATTPFGAPIIHGTLGLNLLMSALDRTFGGMPDGATVEVRFTRPVPVGTAIRAGGRLGEADGCTYEVFVETVAGERVVEGVCTIPPDTNQNITGRNAP